MTIALLAAYVIIAILSFTQLRKISNMRVDRVLTESKVRMLMWFWIIWMLLFISSLISIAKIIWGIVS